MEVNAGHCMRILAQESIFGPRTQIDRAAVTATLMLLSTVEHRSGSEILNVIILLSRLLLVHLLLSRRLVLRGHAVKAVSDVLLNSLSFPHSRILLHGIAKHGTILLLQANRRFDTRYLRDEILNLFLILKVTRAATI